MATAVGMSANITPRTLDDNNNPQVILGQFTIPAGLRYFSATVLTGPAIFNGVSVEAGVTVRREVTERGEVLPGFDIDATNARVLIDTLREV